MLPLTEARRNDEIISLSDSQILRFIDELNGAEDSDLVAKNIKNEIKLMRKQPNSAHNKRIIKKLYEKLDETQFKPDYMCLIIDKKSDYWRACRGFQINGIKYVRLLGTNGGVKNSTIVFVSERLYPELKKRIDNGRDMNKELVPAKLEAYQALVCSGSIPVSMPKGIAVVNDCVTHFREDIIYLNDECDGEPTMEFLKNEEVELIDSDGYGLMLPSLAKRWSEDLRLDYMVSGVNTRFSFEKGMVFTFDFLEFADSVAGTRIIKDAWGNEVDLTNVELILTTSMLKLWDSYDSMDDYLYNCMENKYTFSVTKACPKELERERNLNYQFIQSYDLDDDQIEELISPTIAEIHDVLGLDWKKTVLFLSGSGLNDDTIRNVKDGYSKAIMINPDVLNDQFVQKRVYDLISRRISDAKIGVIKIHGNFSIISGDPYSLCQSMFGLHVTGLLKAGQIYNKYWLDCGAERVVCFRAPMTCHNNIRLMEVAGGDEMKHWYQYMNTCTLLNSWDTTTHALNGADKDGDMVLITDNKILIENTRKLPSIVCAQRRANKCVATEDDMVQANINSFGDDIGKITNRITSMFAVRAKYPAGSPEREILDYRIKCGQLFQQNAIDKAKGIIAKPMPADWYTKKCVAGGVDDLRFRIVADKKPYFMRYIYPEEMRNYREYLNKTNKKCLREFCQTVSELENKPRDSLTNDEKTFLFYYNIKMPVEVGDCVMNRICRRFEEEFDGYFSKKGDAEVFDYRILRGHSEYSAYLYGAVYDIYVRYNNELMSLTRQFKIDRVSSEDAAEAKSRLVSYFTRDCDLVCPNEETLCNILLDMCYQNESTKAFVWDISLRQIIRNLLNKSGGNISYPVLDDTGTITYGGNKYKIHTQNVEANDIEHNHE